MPSYYFWTNKAKRWSECVDFGSPMTAWTDEMMEILEKCDGDFKEATTMYRELKAEKCSLGTSHL